MSALIDRLDCIAKPEPPPMGFRAAPVNTPKPQLVLIAAVAPADLNKLKKGLDGADAALLRMAGAEAADLEKAMKMTPGLPWGGWFSGISRAEVPTVAGVKSDFIVFPAATTSLALPAEGDVGRILEIDTGLTEGFLRTVDKLPVDAVLVSDGGNWGELTWQHRILLQRIADWVTNPILLFLPAEVTSEELQVIWETGVDALVIPVSPDQPERLPNLRQLADKLKPMPQRKGRKRDVLLPRIAPEASAPPEEEEEEEDD